MKHEKIIKELLERGIDIDSNSNNVGIEAEKDNYYLYAHKYFDSVDLIECDLLIINKPVEITDSEREIIKNALDKAADEYLEEKERKEFESQQEIEKPWHPYDDARHNYKL